MYEQYDRTTQKYEVGQHVVIREDLNESMPNVAPGMRKYRGKAYVIKEKEHVGQIFPSYKLACIPYHWEDYMLIPVDVDKNTLLTRLIRGEISEETYQKILEHTSTT